MQDVTKKDVLRFTVCRIFLSWLTLCNTLAIFTSSVMLQYAGISEGTQWRIWLRHGTASRKVVDSIPDVVIESFHLHNPSDRTCPGVDSASNRNEYQEYFLGGKGGRCVRLTTLPPSYAASLAIWEPQTPGTPGPVQACTRIVYLFFTHIFHGLTPQRSLVLFATLRYMH
jgi:hypothetical protein